LRPYRAGEIEHDDVWRRIGDEAQSLASGDGMQHFIAGRLQAGRRKRRICGSSSTTRTRRPLCRPRRCGGRGDAGQLNDDARAATARRRTFRVDGPAHRLDEPAADRQAEPGPGLAAVRAAALVEFLEYAFRSDGFTRAFVGDRNLRVGAEARA